MEHMKKGRRSLAELARTHQGQRATEQLHQKMEQRATEQLRQKMGEELWSLKKDRERKAHEAALALKQSMVEQRHVLAERRPALSVNAAMAMEERRALADKQEASSVLSESDMALWTVEKRRAAAQRDVVVQKRTVLHPYSIAQQRVPAAPSDRQRILLMRHGESVANASGRDHADALLTDKGVNQAMSWQDELAKYCTAEVVLTSPLRRAVQTACLAFAAYDVSMEICHEARETNWAAAQNNIFSSLEDMRRLLAQLPYGSRVRGATTALDQRLWPRSEDESISRLKNILRQRREKNIAVVCHMGTIAELIGKPGYMVKNCEILECTWGANDELQVTGKLSAPYLRRSNI